MSIKVKSNPNANAVNFIGSSNSTFWNAHLEGEVNADDNTRINVVNKVVGTSDEPVYEFWAIPFQEILDKNGNGFSTADSAATYITAECNLVLGDGTLEVGLTNTLDFELDGTSTTIIVSDGRTYAANTLQAYEQVNGLIGILPKFGVTEERTPLYSDIYISNLTVAAQPTQGTTASVVNFLNGFFSVQALGAGGTSIRPTFSYQDPVDIVFTTFGAETSWDSTGGAGLVRTTTLDGAANFREGGHTNQRISTAGSYFEWKQRTNHGVKNSIGLMRQENFGNLLSNARSHDHSDLNLQINSNILRTRAKDRDIAAPIKDKGFVREEILQTPRTWRAGLNTDRRLYIGYFDDLGIFVDVGRSATPVLEDDSYALVGFLRNTGTLDFDSCKVYAAVNEADDGENTLNLSYRFIESPDGSFHHPLFATAEEANQYDSAQGGSGTSSSQVYTDEPTSATWFSPSTGFTTGGASAPANSGEVVYNEIPTNDDNLYAPPGFGNNSATVNEGGAINTQVVPAGAAGFATTIIDNDGLGVTLNGQYVEGTAPQIAGNNIDNPSDDFTVTVRRTNAFGATDGTLTVTVNNLTAPATAITGFTHVGASNALIDSDTLDSGSVVTFDNTLERPYRTYIRQAWVETNVLPNLQEAGDQIFVGIVDSSGDITTSSVIDSDFLAWTCWEYGNGANHVNTIGAKGHTSNDVTINSATDAFYDYAFEYDDEDQLYVIACNINDISTQPGVSHGGDFSRWRQVHANNNLVGKGPFTISATPISTTMDISVDSDISEIVIPVAQRWIQVRDSAGTYLFDDSDVMPTLAAGYTYRFLMADVDWANQTDSTNLDASEVLRFYSTSTGAEVTAGITRDGAVGSEFAYVEFALDSAIEPTGWAINDSAGAATGFSISGSTHVAAVTGVTQEGPAANQTGDNWFDSDDHGWLSLDDTLSAGQRLVFNSTFWTDLLADMPIDTSIAIGLKDPSWSNTSSDTGGDAGNMYTANFAGVFIGGAFIKIQKQGNHGTVKAQVGITGQKTLKRNFVGYASGQNAFIEITADGDQIRAGYGFTGAGSGSAADAASTPYEFWPAEFGNNYSRRISTGNQNFNISNAEVMIIGGQGGLGASGQTIAISDVDWTELSEIPVPSLPASITTNYSKALDFSGGSQYAKQTNSAINLQPLRMGGVGSTVSGNGQSGYTSNLSNARPWAVTCVFKIDGNSSNQHIWNQGEGAGSVDDNIYLRLDSSRNLLLGWGRQGAVNEMWIAQLDTTSWYGVYVASTGERLSGSDATPTNLRDCFDIRIMSSSNGWSGSDTNLSTSAAWSDSRSTTGGRMDRVVEGDFTIGGRSGNRNFHGKIASCVVTTMRISNYMPSRPEVLKMTIDPKQWLTDYKVGVQYRYCNSSNGQVFSRNNQSSSDATQVWLMGDGTNDAYAKIRNQAYPALQSRTTLDMNSMVSSDIETVSISGLTD